ncbi:MAG TPA: hypothetical protein VFE46_07855 [Pirellulales bacterium]|jgi:hypothetical protein|nr:hypothetical protein [Pirellulales bacterium]
MIDRLEFEQRFLEAERKEKLLEQRMIDLDALAEAARGEPSSPEKLEKLKRLEQRFEQRFFDHVDLEREQEFLITEADSLIAELAKLTKEELER